MKIVLTGALGHISKPLAEELVSKGHQVIIISSKAEKTAEIEQSGGIPAIGSIEDANFLTSTFTGADAAYCMIPPNYTEPDQKTYYRRIGNNYAQAIRQSGIRRVVDLSSYGAHLEKGTGFIVGSYQVEKTLEQIPGLSLTHIRPAYFYYNLLNFIHMIKTAGFIGANYGGSDKLVLVSPADIAAAIADEIVKTPAVRNIRYVASDERSCNEIAQVIGEAIGQPDLKWNIFTNEQMMSGLTENGVPESIAANLTELGAAIHSGMLTEDYDQHKPVLGKVKITDYVKEFAAAYK